MKSAFADAVDWIAIARPNDPWSQAAKSAKAGLGRKLAEPQPRTVEVCVSVIAEMELLSFPFPQASEASGMKAFHEMIEIIPLTNPVKHRAIELRRNRQLKLPDAIIAGTALALSAELWSNDTRFQRVAGLRTTQLRLKTL